MAIFEDVAMAGFAGYSVGTRKTKSANGLKLSKRNFADFTPPNIVRAL
jgi:hypothetical protein